MPALTGRGSWLLAQMGRGDRVWGRRGHVRGGAQETGKMKPLLSLWKRGAQGYVNVWNGTLIGPLWAYLNVDIHSFIL